MRILITGASGFVGWHLASRLGHEHDVVGVVFHNPRSPAFRHVRIDLTDERAVESYLGSNSPEIIVHSAALSRIIACEDAPKLAVTANVNSTMFLARGAAGVKARFLFISTDQVFSGSQGHYRESDEPAPVSQYGRTKLAAEAIALSCSDNALVIRSNSVVGSSHGWGESFTDMVLGKLRRREKLSLFADQYRSPIHIRAMCEVLEAACMSDVRGILHVGGTRRMSRSETGLAVASAFGLSRDLIETGSYRSHPRAHLMTEDTSYDISKLGHLLPAVRQRPLEEEFANDAKERP